MIGNGRRFLLWGYLTVALGGIVLSKVYGNWFWTLLRVPDAAAHPFSVSLLPGMLAFTLLFAITVFFSAPTNPLFCIAAGYLYGVLPGTVTAVLGGTLGSAAAFLFFRKTIVPPPSYRRLEIDNLFLVLVLLRSSPWLPSPLINLFCGTGTVRFSVFVASTVLGSVPLVSVYTLFASRLTGPLDASLLRSPELITALSVLTAVSLLSFLKPLRVFANHLRALAAALPRPEIRKRVRGAR